MEYILPKPTRHLKFTYDSLSLKTLEWVTCCDKAGNNTSEALDSISRWKPSHQQCNCIVYRVVSVLKITKC